MGFYDILLAKQLGGGGGGITPTGTYSITSNGIYDVASYASADVNVPAVLPNIQSLDITANGTYSVSGSVDGYNPITVNVQSGGDDDRFAKMVQGTILTAEDSTVTSIRADAFYSCRSLSTASFPNVTTIGESAFRDCMSLTTLSFPNATIISTNAFSGCTYLTTASFPKVTSIGTSAFMGCVRLQTATFDNVTSIGIQAFRSCSRFISIYLPGSSVPTLVSNAFQSTPIGGYSTVAGQYGSVFVPSSLYNTYISATNWSTISSRIVSM